MARKKHSTPNNQSQHQEVKKKGCSKLQKIGITVLFLALAWRAAAEFLNSCGEKKLEQDNQPEEALKYFNIAIMMAQIDSQYYYNRAQTYLHLNNLEGAIQDAKSAEWFYKYNYIDTNNIKAFYNLVNTKLINKENKQLNSTTEEKETEKKEEDDTQTTENLEAEILSGFNKNLNDLQLSIKAESKLLQNIPYIEENIEDTLVAYDKIQDGFSKSTVKKRTDKGDLLYTTEKHNINEAVITIPLKELITSYNLIQNTYKSNNVTRQIINSTSLDSQHYFAAYLLLVSQENSKYSSIITSFKEASLGHPGTYSKSDLYLFEGSLVKEQINAVAQDYQSGYDKITNAYPDFKNFTNEEFKSISVGVKQRLFRQKLNSRYVEMLAPKTDIFFNENEANLMPYFDEEKQLFVLKATKNIKADRVLSLGIHSEFDNIEMLKIHGILSNNLPNIGTLELGFKWDDKLLDKKKNTLLETEEKSFNFKLVQMLSSNSFWNCLGFLRLVETDGSDEMNKLTAHFAKLSKTQIKNKIGSQEFKFIKFISIANEVKALQNLKEACQEQLGTFSTTQQQDLQQLKKSNLQANERMILDFVYREKSAYNYYIHFVDEITSLFNLPIKDAKQKVQEKKYKPFNSYIKQVVIPALEKQ